ncbi:MAG: 4Fe-4S binding protein [Coriobacteriia bacterium]|nr:4Fe-4S binding protein [Coriobacteriia bacterium]
MTQYAFFFDNSRCTGCRTCQMACKDYKDLACDISYRKVYDYEGGTTEVGEDGTVTTSCFMYHLSVSCNHCDDPACARVCPTGAMHKDPETGLVSVDEGKCIGCGYCHMACPYNSPEVDREVGHSVKCDGCADRVSQGLEPICVGACPLRALSFGTAEEMAALGDQAAIAPLPEADLTNPNLYILPCPAASAEAASQGTVTNIKEVLQ